MNGSGNTIFLRLSGLMQSWGTSSQFQIRRTDGYPSKSGVLGLLLCAMGVSRADSSRELESLRPLAMGVRVDRAGNSDWDYQTAGAKIGIRSADGKIKVTDSTGEFETLLSRRQYLYDASFLVALQGPTEVIQACADALEDPVWPVFLGRKSCIPSEPIFTGTGDFHGIHQALSSIPWQGRPGDIGGFGEGSEVTLKAYIEHTDLSTPPPIDVRIVHDVPRTFGFHSHDARSVISDTVTAPVLMPPRRVGPGSRIRRLDYSSAQWREARLIRLDADDYLCVFCKSEAREVHHVTYENVGEETNADLRSLCRICHDACTMLEYGRDLRLRRVDPSAPEQREEILAQITKILSERRMGRRRELLETSRLTRSDLSDVAPAG